MTRAEKEITLRTAPIDHRLDHLDQLGNLLHLIENRPPIAPGEGFGSHLAKIRPEHGVVETQVFEALADHAPRQGRLADLARPREDQHRLPIALPPPFEILRNPT